MCRSAHGQVSFLLPVSERCSKPCAFPGLRGAIEEDAVP